VPVFRDWPGVRSLLHALEDQTGAPPFEVLLVNNDPGDPAPDDLPSIANLNLMTEARPGSYAARNRGAAQAKGNLLVFTDADCTPRPDWLARLAAAARHHEGLLSGRVEMVSTRSSMARLNMAESYDYFFGINQEIYARDGVAATANLAIPRAVWDRVGGFDARLKSGGDVAFCRAAARAGAALCHVPDAVVRHPLRDSFGAVLAKARRVAGGRAQRDGWRALAITLAPPLVRLRILFLDKTSPGGWVRAQGFCAIFAVKLVEIVETVVVLGKLRPARR
jgi:glycosyltransferase involved in cell wall biosynthesis